MSVRLMIVHEPAHDGATGFWRDPEVAEVVAWLREQGAIDYEAAQWAYFHRDDHAIPWESKARLVVDAALPGGNE